MNDLEKEFVLYPEALALKELGFDEPCLCFYNHNGQLVRYMNPDKDWNSLQSQIIKNSKITLPNTYSAPTYSQAFRFFRENYGLRGVVIPHWLNNSYFIIIEGKLLLDEKDNIIYHHEEAELLCLQKLIELCQKK